MSVLIVLQGLPASGKTTYANMLVDQSKGQIKRVNKDDLRAMLDNGTWTHENEKLIMDVRDMICRRMLQEGKTVIVDDTNLHPKHIAHLQHLAAECGATFTVDDQFLNVSVDECIERDRWRDRSVGEEVIRGMLPLKRAALRDKYGGDDAARLQ